MGSRTEGIATATYFANWRFPTPRQIIHLVVVASPHAAAGAALHLPRGAADGTL
jgi:hypothetical protein